MRTPARLSKGVALGVLALVGSLATLGVAAPVGAAVQQPSGDATATVETDPVAGTGDAADDPAIWRDRNDPARSVVIGNDKSGALEVYDLAGNRNQRINRADFGNRAPSDCSSLPTTSLG